MIYRILVIAELFSGLKLSRPKPTKCVRRFANHKQGMR